MKRKAIQLAKKTLVISLPAKWVKKYQVKKGEELDIQQNKHALQISINQKQEKKTKIIDANDWERLLPRYLISLYQKGVSEFEIKFNSPEALKKIQFISAQLVGFETIKQEKDKIVLKDITGPSDEEFTIVFRRLFLLVLDIFQDGLIALKANNKKQIETLILRDVEINKFSHFCLRKLNKGDVEDEEKARIYYFIAILLEKIGDEFREILRINPPKQQIKHLEEIGKLLRLCYELTMKTSSSTALDIASQYDKLKSKNLSPELKSLTELIIPIQMQQLGLV